MNARRSIWFQTTRTGQRQAFYWSGRAGRAIRMPLAEAEMLIATEQAVRISGHPLRPMG